MNPYIRSTKVYSKFNLNFLNRNVKEDLHSRALEASMRKHGWLLAYPMHCVEEDGLLVIKDGHQRMSAAIKIGLAARYAICDDTLTIAELNETFNPWTLQDFLDSHVRAGNMNYIAVQDYVEETGLSLSTSIALLAGRNAGSSHQTIKFKKGIYTLGDPWLSKQIKLIVSELRSLELPFATSSLLAQALSKALWVPVFFVGQFRTKVQRYGRKILKKQATIDAYLKNIQELHNHRNSKKLPLAFMAEEAAQQRNVSYGK